MGINYNNLINTAINTNGIKNNNNSPVIVSSFNSSNNIIKANHPILDSMKNPLKELNIISPQTP